MAPTGSFLPETLPDDPRKRANCLFFIPTGRVLSDLVPDGRCLSFPVILAPFPLLRLHSIFPPYIIPGPSLSLPARPEIFHRSSRIINRLIFAPDPTDTDSQSYEIFIPLHRFLVVIIKQFYDEIGICNGQ